MDGRGGRFSIRLRKCYVSFVYDGRMLARSWMKSVMQAER